ncbi:MAG: primosomal protein N' [Candidatus Krumholzibacteria bacterium]|nr:primosomal protein N' [Candidatus Krumholzibacteria bacterium]
MDQTTSCQLLEIALPVPLDQTFSYRYAAPAAAPPAVVGDLVVVPFGRRKKVTGLVVGVQELDFEAKEAGGVKLKDVGKVYGPEYRVNAERLKVARWLADYYMLPMGEVVPLFHPPAPGTKARGGRAADEDYPTVDQPLITLSGAQKIAVAAGSAHLKDHKYAGLLLHGVTGSGKTEVYLTLIEEALALGRTAIFLLPEIALTPQTLSRISARFGERVAAIHSGLSAGQRCLVHEGAARGEIDVVVGPRSALFAPLQNLGIIVVDEEHENSYKQDEKPRYHARHTALVRGRENKALVVLGSATPDLESMNNARSERLELLELPERMGGTLPVVEVVDMRGAQTIEGFTPALTEAMQQTLESGKQIILYYNRRGFARVVQCTSCGEVVMCPNCDIGLTYHLRPRRLLCHYCGYTDSLPETGPDCGADETKPSGGGTEKVELHLQAHFPEARLLRLDRDTTTRRGSHKKILAAFARGEADILIGTQMVAKGHHFPNVSLVGVLAADDGLGLPDFRAAERSFQLLTQVAGRSGRTGNGRVIFQAWQPEHPVIQAAAAHNYGAFIDDELPARKALGYPPHRRLLRLGVTGKRQGEASEAADRLAEVIRGSFVRPGLTVLGPAPAVFPRLHDRFRFQILIKGTLNKGEKAWLRGVLANLRTSYRGIDAVHDVDPVSVY